jgi:hypothetical protein
MIRLFKPTQVSLPWGTPIIVLLLTAFLGPTPAFAGGSWEPVRVLKLRLLSNTNYDLVVSTSPSSDRYFGKCRLFEVHGTLARLTGEFPFGATRGPSKEIHQAALRFLKPYEGKSSAVAFGWMGDGFGIADRKHPCNVESRGLQLVRDPMQKHQFAVLSYFSGN